MLLKWESAPLDRNEKVLEDICCGGIMGRAISVFLFLQGAMRISTREIGLRMVDLQCIYATLSGSLLRVGAGRFYV